MKEFVICLVIYFVVINIVAAIITIYDKRMAIKHKRRVPERTLLVLAGLSGCIIEYTVMKLIRHKTQKNKFMIGIPIIFILEVIFVTAIVLILK